MKNAAKNLAAITAAAAMAAVILLAAAGPALAYATCTPQAAVQAAREAGFERPGVRRIAPSGVEIIALGRAPRTVAPAGAGGLQWCRIGFVHADGGAGAASAYAPQDCGAGGYSPACYCRISNVTCTLTE
jgi:hypothetical protein